MAGLGAERGGVPGTKGLPSKRCDGTAYKGKRENVKGVEVPRQSVGADEFIQMRVSSRYRRLETTALRGSWLLATLFQSLAWNAPWPASSDYQALQE